VDLLGPHLTLVFPVPTSVGFDAIRAHVGDVLARTRAFDIPEVADRPEHP